jgi:serine/threonine protein kinase
MIRTLRSVGSVSPLSLGSVTQMGSVMGTPAYMPPEQALGEIDRLDERTDVFGLRSILCEILTGETSYVAASGGQVIRLASRGKLEDCYARLDASEVDAELIQIKDGSIENG